MKKAVILSLLLIAAFPMLSQIETSTGSIRIEAETNADDNTSSGLELPRISAPSMTEPTEGISILNNDDLGEEEESNVNFAEDDGLVDYKSDKTPKYFDKKEKSVLPEYYNDQSLGEVYTGSEYVTIMCRDHEAVDGDQVRIFANKDVIRPQVTLGSGFTTIKLRLEPGLNTIVFEALNQGDSGPNTAELHVYDDDGRIISAEEWNLATGYKATISFIKN
ncbi:hypothetical protein MG296_09255 [Flavobacteriaceae bacterium TK19130]|nr:hypothetical protein [Thermobacterium salinum]